MSTNINEIANLPINFEIGGKTLRIARLNLAEIFGYFETKVKEQHLKNIKDVSNIFDNPKEKMDYLKQATKEIPNKIELQKMAQEYLQSEDGIADVLSIALNKCQKLSEQDMIDLFTKATEVEIQLLFNHIFGIEVKEINNDSTVDLKKNL